MKKNRMWLAVGCLVVVLVLLAGCTQVGQTDSAVSSLPYVVPSLGVVSDVQSSAVPSMGLSEENYPRVDGSTATLPLMAAIRSEICGTSMEEAEALVVASKTADAWRGLLDKQSDLLLVYEAPQELISSLGLGETLLADPIGLDGLVFLTNKNNAVNNLTQQQLRDIYAGKALNWKDVGGEDGEIAAYQRNPDSGSQTMFIKLLMGEVAPMEPPKEFVSGGMSGLIDVISTYKGKDGAIGYSVFYYASEMYANPNLKMLAVDGVAPSNETLADGSYPLTNEFYVAIRADEPQGSPARILRDWILSEAGRDAMVRAGYLPVKK